MVKEFLTKNAKICDTVICVRGVREYKLKKKQFLESSGIVTIEESSGLLITSAIISGKCNMKNVTDVIKEYVGQVKCPLDIIHIDTGKLNEFTGHDIEPGTPKLLQIEYITDDKTCKERRVCCKPKKHDCKHKKCDLESHCKPKRHHHCSDIDDTKYVCLDNIKPKCENKPKHHHCSEHIKHKCENKPTHHKCERKPTHHNCERKPKHHCRHMAKRLLFPLYPIRGEFVYPLLNDHERHHHKCNCVGRCTC